MEILKQIFEILVSYIVTDVRKTITLHYITVDGNKYFFVDNGYDDDFADLSISVDIHESKKLGMLKSYLILVNTSNSISIGLLDRDIVTKIGGFNKTFFSKEFTLNKETNEITEK